jgi:hypothetical protein
MKTFIMTLLLIGSSAVASPLWAQDTETCTVPIYLLSSDSRLNRVAEDVKNHKALNIVVVGSRSALLAGPDGPSASFPARLEAVLRERLAGVTVKVTTDLKPKTSAADAATGFDALLKDQKPTLVIWQTGTVDAMRAIDPDDFRSALTNGIAALQKGGTDVVMMNLQYTPRIESMLSVSPYNDTMRVVAQEKDVPVFDRFSIMRHWSEAGDFDLFDSTHGLAMAKRVHDCIGHALATLIMDDAHINRAELGIR